MSKQNLKEVAAIFRKMQQLSIKLLAGKDTQDIRLAQILKLGKYAMKDEFAKATIMKPGRLKMVCLLLIFTFILLFLTFSYLPQKTKCKLGIHEWYYGDYTISRRSKFTGDLIGRWERHCLECPKKQIKVYGKKNDIWLDSYYYKSIIEAYESAQINTIAI